MTFWFTCNWPLNLNCSLGVGLETALFDVGFWSIVIFVILSILLPATLLPLIGGSGIIFFLIAIGAYGFHYSPRCFLMSPPLYFGAIGGLGEDSQIPIPGLSFLAWLSRGVTIPLYPFALAFPAFPECLMDELIGLFDKYITNCYAFLEDTPLGFILPHYMINGKFLHSPTLFFPNY